MGKIGGRRARKNFKFKLEDFKNLG